MSESATSAREGARLRNSWRLGLRLLFSIGMLAALLWWLQPEVLSAAVNVAAPGWLVLGLLISVPQVLVSAWRWRLTAQQMGLSLRMKHAFREYYLATFLNQVLPGGIAGDMGRAWRHAGGAADRRRAWHAVFIERASGQLALVVIGGAAILVSPPLQQGFMRLSNVSDGAASMWLALPVVLFAVGGWWLRAALRMLWGDISQALLTRAVFPQQFVSSMFVVASYVAVYFCCAQALALADPISLVLPLIPLVLLAMALPLSVAGWGLREGAAAIVWLLAGLPPEQGVAISVLYGLTVLVSSLPGAFVLVLGMVRHRANAALKAGHKA